MTQNRNITRRVAAAAVLAATASVLVAAQPASAASHRTCTIEKHGTTSGVVKQGGASFVLGPDGIKLSTGSDNNDKVSWKTTFRPVAASTVNEVNYETIKLDQAGENVNDAALPSYHIFVKTPAGDGTLVFEPYWYTSKLNLGNPQRGLRTEWDVLAGDLWTPSTTIAGMEKTAGGGPGEESIPGKGMLTFAEVVQLNPRMTVTGIGFGLGTYNKNTVAVIDEQRFATKTDCQEHQWSTGFKSGSWWPGWLWLR